MAVDRVKVLADMAGKHAAGDVYDLWVEVRDASVLFGWNRYDERQLTFNLTRDGMVQPIGRPWALEQQGLSYRAVLEGDRWLSVMDKLRDDPQDPYFDIECMVLNSGEYHDFHGEGVSLLFPAVCVAADNTPWVAWIRCGDVENADGVIDQFNEIECARLENGEWVREVVADLRYGLQPKAGVWGYEGRRRRPYIVPDDRGGVWLLWERKEPHDGSTTQVSGILCGRRYAEGCWEDPVRLIEAAYMDYFPAMRGVEDGAIVVAAQRGCPSAGPPGRGEVVVLSVEVDGAPALEPDSGFEQWQSVNLAEREFFLPAERQMTLGEETCQLLFGDPHTHTCLSTDAEGDLIEMLSYARDKAKLDYVAITDNDYIYGGRLSDEAWHHTMAEEQMWSQDGKFIAVPGYEWTQASWGPISPQHRSILFASYDQPILRWYDVEGDPIAALVSWVASTDGIMNTQHPEFYLTGSEREANMEVCCGWGDYINKSECFHEHLNRGFRAGFVGTSDGHRRTPGLGGGLTGLWVREFTLAGIIEAFRERRCYATAGARIGLRFWINEAFMGQTLSGDGPRTARVIVEAPREVERLEIFGDGEIVAALTGLPATFDEQIADLPMCSWYYAKVTLPGGFPEYPSNIAPAEGPWAWSSPVFVGD